MYVREPRPKDIPSRDSRAVLYDRYRGYDLRESEIQTLTDLGKFRVINAEDLARHGYGGDRGRMERETESLIRQGLVEQKRFEISLSKSRRMYTLTKAGRRLIERSGRVRNDQEIYAGFVKPREAKHDSELYRVYQKEEDRIERRGGKAKGQYQMLYALLAGCGPLRVGEALGLEIDKHIFPDCRTLHIIQKAKRGDIQQYLKTKHGKRYVDLCTPLAAMLRDFIGTRTSGLLFQTSTGAQLLQSNTLQDSLHPILKSMKHVQGGFNIFRRYRLSYIDKSDCPEALRHFWSGHAPRHVSERYIKLMNDRQYRLDWAERLGTGFQIPGSVGLLGLLRVVPKIA